MPIRLTCPSCSATLSVKDEYAGRAVKCPKCGGVIPASQPAAPAAPAAAPPPAKATPAAPPPGDDPRAGIAEKPPHVASSVGASTDSSRRVVVSLSRADLELFRSVRVAAPATGDPFAERPLLPDPLRQALEPGSL